jgi:uncharacterized protein (DUF1786 family)
MMRSPWVDRNTLGGGATLKAVFAGVQKGAAVFFLASIGVSIVAALEQVERMRKKYSYGETVSRKNPLTLGTNLPGERA